MSSSLHLIDPLPNVNLAQQAEESKPSAVQNLLDHFNLMPVYEAFSQSSSKTFKSYIRHLPGDFHVSKQGRVDPAGSLKKVLENAPPPADEQPIVFRPLSERQLQAAFALQDGGYKRKKKKKKDKENGGSGGSEEKKHKKRKRHKDGMETSDEPSKKKKKKKDKDKKASPDTKPQTPIQPLYHTNGNGFTRNH